MAQNRDQLRALKMDAASQSSRTTSPWIWIERKSPFGLLGHELDAVIESNWAASADG